MIFPLITSSTFEYFYLEIIEVTQWANALTAKIDDINLILKLT